jgi:hypothetical protein
MEPEGARKLLESEVRIQGQQLEFRYNRDGYKANFRRQSRVLVIEGPKEMMTRRYVSNLPIFLHSVTSRESSGCLRSFEKWKD